MVHHASMDDTETAAGSIACRFTAGFFPPLHASLPARLFASRLNVFFLAMLEEPARG